MENRLTQTASEVQELLNKVKPIEQAQEVLATKQEEFPLVKGANGSPVNAVEMRGCSATGDRSTAVGYSATASANEAHAEGYNAEASGQASHAEGNTTKAIGAKSHAEGYETKANGENSHAEGQRTVANGNGSHAEGYATEASGATSHAEGFETQAAEKAHAEGYKTKAMGYMSHAEGRETFADEESAHAEGYATEASGRASHAEGQDTIADGNASHAEGNSTSAQALGSHAEGMGTLASGNSSHAEGSGTRATGAQAHAEGRGTRANNNYEHAEGAYNMSNTGTRHSVGIGMNDADRKNAFEIMDDGRVFMHGVGGYDGTNAAAESQPATVQEEITGIKATANKAKTKAIKAARDNRVIVGRYIPIHAEPGSRYGVSQQGRLIVKIPTSEIIPDYVATKNTFLNNIYVYLIADACTLTVPDAETWATLVSMLINDISMYQEAVPGKVVNLKNEDIFSLATRNAWNNLFETNAGNLSGVLETRSPGIYLTRMTLFNTNEVRGSNLIDILQPGGRTIDKVYSYDDFYMSNSVKLYKYSRNTLSEEKKLLAGITHRRAKYRPANYKRCGGVYIARHMWRRRLVSVKYKKLIWIHMSQKGVGNIRAVV